MPDSPALTTRRLSRDKLREFLGDRHELIRAFESYIDAISTQMPDAITLAQQTAQRAEALAGQALMQQRDPEDEMPSPPGGNGAAASSTPSLTVGAAEVDFGATANDAATVAVTGQVGVIPSTTVMAWITGAGSDTTPDNPQHAHELAAALISVTTINIVTGGFTLSARCPSLASGRFRVRWAWSN